MLVYRRVSKIVETSFFEYIVGLTSMVHAVHVGKCSCLMQRSIFLIYLHCLTIKNHPNIAAKISRWVVSNIFFVHPYLGEWSNLTNIFHMGWNHSLDTYFHGSYRAWTFSSFPLQRSLSGVTLWQIRCISRTSGRTRCESSFAWRVSCWWPKMRNTTIGKTVVPLGWGPLNDQPHIHLI